MRASPWDRARVALLALLVTGWATSACNQAFGPSRVDANWRLHESNRFLLHVRPGSFADENATAIGEALDHQYDATLATLGAQFDRRVTGFLFNSSEDAQLASDYSGVAYPETLAFRATCVPPLGISLHSLLGHEANHVIIIGALGRAGTRMMTEGLASAVLSPQHTAGPAHYFAWTKTHRSEIPSLARLTDDSQWEDIPENVSYTAGASFLAFLLETRGSEQLRAIYYAKSSEFAVRVTTVYGRSLTELEAEWLAFCERYTW